MQRSDEHHRLVRHIIEHVRMLIPSLPPAEAFRLRQRLEKSTTEVLRQILEEDGIGQAALAVNACAHGNGPCRLCADTPPVRHLPVSLARYIDEMEGAR